MPAFHFLSQFQSLQLFTIIIIHNIFHLIITISFCFLFSMIFSIFYFSLSDFYWWKFSLVYFYLFSYFKSNTLCSSLCYKYLLLLMVYHILFHSFILDSIMIPYILIIQLQKLPPLSTFCQYCFIHPPCYLHWILLFFNFLKNFTLFFPLILNFCNFIT